MKSIINKSLFALVMAALFVFAGCKDDLEEITTLDVSRLFSPTDIEVRVVNQTSVRLIWNRVNKATAYNVEFHEGTGPDFAGAPFKAITGVRFDQLPLVIPGFAGETTYTVRVRAIGQGIDDSKWTSVTFTTGTEQIFFPVNPEEVTATSVVLRWPAGEMATHITLEPGGIVRQVSAPEVANGAAQVTNLVGETEYIAKLMNQNKVRGTISFKTLIDLGGATPVYHTDNLNDMVVAAMPGDVLVLFPGVYEVYRGDIIINKPITIKGMYPHQKPVISNRFVISPGATDVVFSDLVMDGVFAPATDTRLHAFLFAPGNYTVNSVSISGCIIRNYTRAFISGAPSGIVVRVEDIHVHNSIVSNIVCEGGDFIDFRFGHVANLRITNSTFDRVALARDFIRLDNTSAVFPGSISKVLIDKCTFYQVSNTRRILYIRFVNNESTVTNTIFAGADETYTGYFSNQVLTAQPFCHRNNYFNAPRFLGGVPSGLFDISGTHTTLNPGFVNPTAGNFTVTNEELIFRRIGDPRWLP